MGYKRFFASTLFKFSVFRGINAVREYTRGSDDMVASGDYFSDLVGADGAVDSICSSMQYYLYGLFQMQGDINDTAYCSGLLYHAALALALTSLFTVSEYITNKIENNQPENIEMPRECAALCM